MAAFKDLEDYGVIGNLETCALVGRDGSVDWLCFPYLESPSIFTALLDPKYGGFFRIAPVDKFQSGQTYIHHTNILTSTFRTALGTAVVTDFMPVKNTNPSVNIRTLLRRVEATQGLAELEVIYQPRFGYAKNLPGFQTVDQGVICSYGKDALFLHSEIPLRTDPRGAFGSFRLRAGQTAWFVLQYNHREPKSFDQYDEWLEQVRDYWRNWAHACPQNQDCVLGGDYHELVTRSGLALKLLADNQTGAIAAAATTSLPETAGGVRNWDYRFAWIRDSSFTVQSLFHLNHVAEAVGYRDWINRIVQAAEDPARIHILYGIHAECDLREQELDYLSGYKNSRPIRVGNNAAGQRQHDIYGELVSAIFDTTRYGAEVNGLTWNMLRRIIDYVCEIWKEPDSGIWEIRGAPRHYVYSKLMCWAALDKGLKIAKEKHFPAPAERWRQVRGDIRRALLGRGFSAKRNSFVQAFDSEDLDATSLLIPFMDFLPFDDPRIQGTLNAIRRELISPQGLVYRYLSPDRLPGKEGAFLLCTFWLVKALALSGRMEEARDLFERTLRYVSPLGLLSEEVDGVTGKLTGNFPQAFSHIGLVNSALYLGVAAGRQHKGPKPIGLSKAA